MMKGSLIYCHLLRTNIERNVQRMVRRTYTTIQGVKGYMGHYDSRFLERFEHAIPECWKRLYANFTVQQLSYFKETTLQVCETLYVKITKSNISLLVKSLGKMFSIYISMFVFLVSILFNRFISKFCQLKLMIKHSSGCSVLNFLWEFSLVSRLL